MQETVELVHGQGKLGRHVAALGVVTGIGAGVLLVPSIDSTGVGLVDAIQFGLLFLVLLLEDPFLIGTSRLVLVVILLQLLQLSLLLSLLLLQELLAGRGTTRSSSSAAIVQIVAPVRRARRRRDGGEFRGHLVLLFPCYLLVASVPVQDVSRLDCKGLVACCLLLAAP